VRQFTNAKINPRAPATTKMAIEVVSEVPLQINFSKIFYDKLTASMKAVSQSDEAQDKILPLFIQNDSGQMISIWFGDDDACEVCIAPAGSQANPTKHCMLGTDDCCRWHHVCESS
jgi:hypothetical protein